MVRKYIKYGIKIVIVDIVNITVLILIVTVIVIAKDLYVAHTFPLQGRSVPWTSPLESLKQLKR